MAPEEIPIYFWNTPALADDFLKDAVAEAERFKYLVATLLLYHLAAYSLVSTRAKPPSAWLLLQVGVAAFTTLAGIYLCFAANRAGASPIGIVATSPGFTELARATRVFSKSFKSDSSLRSNNESSQGWLIAELRH